VPRLVVLVLLAFAVTLAVIIGMRLSAESMAVVLGVVCGVAAGIPMSLLMLLVSGRRENLPEKANDGLNDRRAAYPPVVVIQGGTAQPNQLVPPYYPSAAMAYEPERRQFHLVGQPEDG
jgi:hypothetical protein